MPEIVSIGRVLVPVADQDEAIEFYTTKLGFSKTADTPFGDGARWVEVGLAGGQTSIALVPPQGDYRPGRVTGISLSSPDPRSVHAELQANGVDVDAELWGGDGPVPLGFFFRDHDKNQLMVVEAR